MLPPTEYQTTHLDASGWAVLADCSNRGGWVCYNWWGDVRPVCHYSTRTNIETISGFIEADEIRLGSRGRSGGGRARPAQNPEFPNSFPAFRGEETC